MAPTNPVQYIKEVKAELTKVTWPTRAQVLRLTSAVIVISLIVGLFVGGLDLLLTKAFELVIKI